MSDRMTQWPQKLAIDASAFIARGAMVVGEVTLGARSSVWFNTVVRGDTAPVVIGADSNVQDNSVVHVDEGQPAVIGARVTIGHRAIVHGCVIGDDCLIGMGSIVLSGARVGAGSLVAAGSLVLEGREIPPGSLVRGAPAKVIGPVAPEHVASIRGGNVHYVALAREYLKRGYGIAPPAPRVERPAHALGHVAVGCAIVTVSDTRGKKDDLSGDALEQGLRAAGHVIAARAWVRDQVTAIRRAVRAALAKRAVGAVILTGGTGVAPRDVTPQALALIVTMPLPGFGELLRSLSFAEIGSAAWLSRSTAGIARGKLVVSLPGSPNAVRFALDHLIVPELSHAMRLLGRIPPKE